MQQPCSWACSWAAASAVGSSTLSPSCWCASRRLGSRCGCLCSVASSPVALSLGSVQPRCSSVVFSLSSLSSSGTASITALGLQERSSSCSCLFEPSASSRCFPLFSLRLLCRSVSTVRLPFSPASSVPRCDAASSSSRASSLRSSERMEALPFTARTSAPSPSNVKKEALPLRRPTRRSVCRPTIDSTAVTTALSASVLRSCSASAVE